MSKRVFFSWAVAASVMLLGAGIVAAKLWPSEGAQGQPASIAAASTPPGATSTAVPSVSATTTATTTATPQVSSRCPEGMVFLAAGTFRMGSEPGDKEAYDDERPAHEVTLSAFCLDRTEVTVASYRKCTKEERHGVQCAPAPTTIAWFGYSEADAKLWSSFCNGDRADRDEHPINCVDWQTADTYCRWAGSALPTEAQWEYAARGKEGRKYPWGDAKPGPALLNACGRECRAMAKRLGETWTVLYEGDDGAEATAPVGKYEKGATREGVLDLAGNAWEWVQDRYAPYDPALSKDPVQTRGTQRVLRGGGWGFVELRHVRSAFRYGGDDGAGFASLGFRCARGPDP